MYLILYSYHCYQKCHFDLILVVILINITAVVVIFIIHISTIIVDMITITIIITIILIIVIITIVIIIIMVITLLVIIISHVSIGTVVITFHENLPLRSCSPVHSKGPRPLRGRTKHLRWIR